MSYFLFTFKELKRCYNIKSRNKTQGFIMSVNTSAVIYISFRNIMEIYIYCYINIYISKVMTISYYNVHNESNL